MNTVHSVQVSVHVDIATGQYRRSPEPREVIEQSKEYKGDRFSDELLNSTYLFMPGSRKPGFSKTELGRRLSRARIHYVHLPDLGAPKLLREDLKSSRDYSAFFKRMDKHLAGKKDAIEEAYRYVINGRCCLMCFEQLADRCHRKMVAERIKVRDGDGLQVEHI